MHFENDTDLYRVIGANIKQYREQAKLTQVQLAEQAKISISYLSKIEASGCENVKATDFCPITDGIACP